MATKLPIGTLHELFAGLQVVDTADGTTLAGEVRLSIAINLNKLRPLIEAYERTRQRTYLDISKKILGDNERETPAQREKLQATFATENDKLRAGEHDVDLERIDVADLKLDENTKINSATLAQLMPILDGVEKRPKPARAARPTTKPPAA